MKGFIIALCIFAFLLMRIVVVVIDFLDRCHDEEHIDYQD